MTDPTPLDRAHAAMHAAPEDDTARLAFFDRLVAAELFLLLSAEAEGDTVDPDLFEVDGARYVLAFDREDRLTAFTGQPSPYAALSGRTLAGMLATEGIGLGLNLGGAPSETLLPADAMAWLSGTLAAAPNEAEARPKELFPPAGLPDRLLSALDARLSSATGLASCAYLAGVAYDDGSRGHLLAFAGALPGAEPALARTVGEALTFSGIEAGALDVAFFGPTDPIVVKLEATGLRFDLPTPDAEGLAPAAPGMNPDHPPRLR